MIIFNNLSKTHNKNTNNQDHDLKMYLVQAGPSVECHPLTADVLLLSEPPVAVFQSGDWVSGSLDVVV